MLEIDLWVWRLVDGELGLLAPDERARAARFVFDRDRDRYVAGRSRLRRILGGYLGRPPGALRFRYGPHGRPSVEGIGFSLSHTGDLAALAVGPCDQLGLDIEALRPIEDGIARDHFAPAEYAALRALPEAERITAFYRCWTRKEAFLKARGTGLTTDLAAFEVTLSVEARLVRCDDEEVAAWRIADVDVAPGVAAAVAGRTGGATLEVRHRRDT